jgi:hypothetical protein
MRALRLIAMSCLLASAGCRTSDPELREGLQMTKPTPVKSESFIQEIQTPPAELKGYDLAGSVSCLPLASDRACIQRKDAVADACAKAQGQTSRCEDCKPVCDKPLSR